MKVQVNREMFAQRRFDSGALGVLDSVFHQFPDPGRYGVRVVREEMPIGQTAFVVDEQSDVMQLDVDLAHLQNSRGSERGGGSIGRPRVVSPKGYVLFYASGGSGYSVQAGRADSKEVAFDSQRLLLGDLFVVNLLEPTTYTVSNALGKARGEIVVSFSEEDAKRLRSLEPVYVQASSRVFDPAEIRLTSTQGLVFRVGDECRIVIAGMRSKHPKPKLPGWRKLR